LCEPSFLPERLRALLGEPLLFLQVLTVRGRTMPLLLDELLLAFL
jgi:hypothetical protein